MSEISASRLFSIEESDLSPITPRRRCVAGAHNGTVMPKRRHSSSIARGSGAREPSYLAVRIGTKAACPYQHPAPIRARHLAPAAKYAPAAHREKKEAEKYGENRHVRFHRMQTALEAAAKADLKHSAATTAWRGGAKGGDQ